MDNKTNKTTNKTKTNKPKNTDKNKPKKLTIKEKAFCREYAKTGNGTQSVYKAGYDCKTDGSASTRANQILKKIEVREEIERLLRPKEEKAVADAAEVMEYFTKVMRGEINDQFGLEAPLNERSKAAQELAKRTVDIENRMKGIPDQSVGIQIDWNMD